jgi:hypothetical protein
MFVSSFCMQGQRENLSELALRRAHEENVWTNSMLGINLTPIGSRRDGELSFPMPKLDQDQVVPD